MRKIMVAVPCMDTAPVEFAASLTALASYGVEDALISYQWNKGTLVYISRDQLAEVALSEPSDLVMWFDTDMVFPPDTLRRLLKHIDAGADIVTGVYYRRKPPYTATVFKTLEPDAETKRIAWTDFDEIPDEPFEVAGCGFGCVLMRTEVFAAVFAKFGQLFAPVFGLGEDLSFCLRARQLGYKILADPTVNLGHVGYIVVDKSTRGIQL